MMQATVAIAIARFRRCCFGRLDRGLAVAIFLTVASPLCSQAQAINEAVPETINSGVLGQRMPAGTLTYLQSIRFIDAGMRYVDPYQAFFISPAGEMCFRTWPTSAPTIYRAYYQYWCAYPQFIGRVEASPSTNAVVFWCKHAYPQCVHRVAPYAAYGALDYSIPVANSLHVQMIPYRQGRMVLENLVYLMGGDLDPW